MVPFPQQDTGLEWVQKTFDLEPRWTRDIALDKISEAVKQCVSQTPCHIGFLAQGAFNKIYVLQIDGVEHVMRISLPVDPTYKTASEVATISFIQAYTSLPLPRIIAYKDHQDNPTGFEWILMSKLPGATLSSVWNSINLEAKFTIIRHLAVAEAALFRNQLQGIGNIYPNKQGALQHNVKRSRVDRIVSMEFFWGSRLRYQGSRGPFQSSVDWTKARLSLAEQECRDKLATSEDEDDLDDAKRTLNIVLRLQSLPELVFGADGDHLEQTMLHHDDLSEHNILVDTQGQLTGVLDWECVPALPLWRACTYPSFLSGSHRSAEPDKRRYKREKNGEITELFQKHYKEYELTLLCRRFIEEMTALEPKWIDVFRASQVKRDFDLAINSCNSEFLARSINKWIDHVSSRHQDIFSLEDAIRR